MINFKKSQSGFLVEFTDNQLYLRGNGEISFPFNALTMIIDKSDIATFRRSSTNDVFFSIRIDQLKFDNVQATKQNVDSLFASTCCSAGSGGGGGADTTIVPASADFSGMTMSFYNSDDEELFGVDLAEVTYSKEEIDNAEQAIVAGIASRAVVTELTQAEYDALSGNTDPNTIYVISDAYPVDMANYYTKPQTNSLFNNYYTKSEVDEALEDIDLSDYYTKTETDTLLTSKVSTTDFETTERATSAALNDLNSRLLAVDAEIGDINNALNNINGNS